VGLFGFLFVGSFGCSCVLRALYAFLIKHFLFIKKKKLRLCGNSRERKRLLLVAKSFDAKIVRFNLYGSVV